MAGLADELRKMAKLSRTRTNLEKIREQVTDLKEHAGAASDLLTAVTAMREAASELGGALDEAGDDNVLTDNWTVDLREALADFVAALPGEDDGDDVTELIEDLDGACEDYESSLDDRDYSREDREEMWDKIMDGLTSVADAI